MLSELSEEMLWGCLASSEKMGQNVKRIGYARRRTSYHTECAPLISSIWLVAIDVVTFNNFGALCMRVHVRARRREQEIVDALVNSLWACAPRQRTCIPPPPPPPGSSSCWTEATEKKLGFLGSSRAMCR